MATSVVPALIDALVTQAPAAVGADVNVFDGFGISEDPADFLMIGVDDPDPQSSGLSARHSQEQLAMGPASNVYRETGSITMAAYSFNGDANQKTARDAVYAIRNAIDGLIRSTRVNGPTPSVLGVTGVMNAYAVAAALQQSVWQANDALLVFSIRFDAQI